MKAREEDDGGRRERVSKARLDDASRLFGRVSQIGPDFKSPTKHSSLIFKVQISANQRSLSLHSRSYSGSSHRIRPTGGEIAISNDPQLHQ